MLSVLCYPIHRLRKLASLHPRSFTFVGVSVVAGTSYWVYTQVEPVLSEISNTLKLMEQQQQQMDPMSQWNEGFALCLEISKTTMHGCAVELRSQIVKMFDLKKIQKTLKTKSRSKRNDSDYEMWTNFKVIGFAQTFAPLYCLSLLNLLIKTQVSIVQRYNSDHPSNKPSNAVFKAYLNTSRFFLSDGAAALCSRVRLALENSEAFQADFKEKWTFDRLEQATASLRGEVEACFASGGDEDYEEFLMEVLFPWKSAETFASTHNLSESDLGFLHEIIAETNLLVRKPIFRSVLRQSLDFCFEIYLETMKANAFVEIHDKIRFAKLISPTVKVFDVLMPPSPSPPTPAQMSHNTPRRNSLSEEKPKSVLDRLHEFVPVHEFCKVVYFPIQSQPSESSQTPVSPPPPSSIWDYLSFPAFDAR